MNSSHYLWKKKLADFLRNSVKPLLKRRPGFFLRFSFLLYILYGKIFLKTLTLLLAFLLGHSFSFSCSRPDLEFCRILS